MSSYPLASTTWDKEEFVAIQRVIDSGRFTMGNEVESFENEFADYVGAKHAVMVNSGSSANLALLTSCRYRENPLLQPGDEVIVPSISFVASAAAITYVGAKPVFVDVNMDDWLINKCIY
jgi:CDP-6-deoxy-D-xylo-4-hexulose-3-dehydrase